MSAGGRPTKLTEELVTKLDKTAESFWSIGDACASLEISDDTWRAWKDKAKIELDSGVEDSLLIRFLGIATRVGGPTRRKLANSALKACLEDPNATHAEKVNAAATILRLDSPSKHEHSGPDGGSIKLGLDAWRESIRVMIDGAKESDTDMIG